MKVELINPDSLQLIFDRDRTAKAGKAIYERFTNDFRFRVNGIEYELDRHGFTDLGSVPRIVQVIYGFEAWRWELSYGTHDCGYSHKGFFHKGKACDFSRAFMDEVLRYMILEEGKIDDRAIMARIVAPPIYAGVRIGGGWNWENRVRRV